MKFNVFNRQTCKPIRLASEPTPYVRVGRKGRIVISDKALSILTGGMNTAIGLEFLQDSDRKTDWYIRLCNSDGFSVRKQKNTSIIQNSRLANEIVEACGECPVTFIVATPPVEDGSDVHALLWRKGEKVKIKRAKK